MSRPKKTTPKYSKWNNNGIVYYRTRIKDADGKRVAILAKSEKELAQKVEEAQRLISEAIFRADNPTVNDYCDKWLEMQSANIMHGTLNDYRSKVKIYIKQTIGDLYMYEVTPDDLKLKVLSKAAAKSESVYSTVHMLLKLIFNSAVESNIIKSSPANNLKSKGGKPAKKREALTDEQVKTLLDATKGLPVNIFILIALYAGLRREEILALTWANVLLDADVPLIKVRQALRHEHNRPIISEILKTDAGRRDIPIPRVLVDTLKEHKKCSQSEYLIANREGNPLSESQWQRLWKTVVVRSTKERTYTRYLGNGKKEIHTVTPVKGEKDKHNPNVVYTIDFYVTPHMLRHTYVTNLILKGIDPKTVQYLAGHKNSKITMDIYAHVMYNQPQDIFDRISKAFE